MRRSSDLRRVLRLQRPQPLCVRHRHAAEAGLVLVEGRIRDAVLAADLCGLHPGIVFADHPDDLLLRKSALSHGSSFLSMDSTISWPDFRGLGHTARSPQNGPAQRVTPAVRAITGQHDGQLYRSRRVRPHYRAATNNTTQNPATA